MNAPINSGGVTFSPMLVMRSLACIVELGTWLGRSATYFALKAPHAVIFTVDLWSNEFLLTDRHYTTSNQNIGNLIILVL